MHFLPKSLQNQSLAILLTTLLFSGQASVFAQSFASLSGKVLDNTGAALPFSTVAVEGLTNKGAACDAYGNYTITNIPVGTYEVTATMVGYQKQTKKITLNSGDKKSLTFSLEESAHALEAVTIVGEKNQAQKLREQSFTVSSIDVAPLQNLNLDVNTVLNRSTGVRIRQQGGLGSDFTFSLNGFSGNQVRFFIDGISSDFLGSSMRFNNIPVNIIERIEVYKGVVPIYLGADALGGAVNIVTSNNTKDFLDVSYNYGSFNTHQAAIASRTTFKNNVVLNTSGFFNYSDNNYEIDVPTGAWVNGKEEFKPYTLFNEAYVSGSVMAEGGVVKAKWADRFLVGIIASRNKKNLQRGRAMVLSPAGDTYTKDHGVTPTLKYQKKDLILKNLSLNVSAVYSYMQAMSVDSSSRKYNWDGTYTLRTDEAGEINWYKTLFRFNDHSTFNTATLEYVLNKKHTFAFNNTYSYFRRKGSDPLASDYNTSVAFAKPNILIKNITGLSYNLSLFDNRWNTTVFGKLFNMNASVEVQDETTLEYYNVVNKKLEYGTGLTTSFFVTEKLQLKASYENTFRLPTSEELFGNGLLILPNTQLLPEKSDNANLGILYGKRFNGHSINAEGGFVFRKAEDFIRLQANGPVARYVNDNNVQIFGAEGSFRYTYKQWITTELNVTYQDIRDRYKGVSYTSPTYMDRIPNQPFLFGNVMIGLASSELGPSKLQLGFNWTTSYVEAFYLNWPSQGQADKGDIPRQLSNDVAVSVSSLSGRYNISLSCWNILDSQLYDNYMVQKPGRTFNVKLRFYIDKFKD